MSSPKIKALTIYPLKSAKGVSLQEIQIDSAGPIWDREWMLVRKQTKAFVSQRTHPQMCQLRCQLEEGFLKVQWPGKEDIEIPLTAPSGEAVEATLFNKTVGSVSIGKSFDLWFSEALQTEVMLVRVPKNNQRTTSGRNGPSTSLRFADGYPFLLTSDSTLKHLNSRLPAPVPMARFRPNIEIEDAPTDQEDQWSSFSINGVNFLAVKACSRCAIIDVDPATGEKSKTVSRELKKYRQKDGSLLFGINLSHTNCGRIHVGAPLENLS